MEASIYFQEMWQLAIQGKEQGIWFWAAFYTFIVCFYSLILQLRTRSWPATRGLLVESEINKFGPTDWAASNQDYVSDVLYHYSVSDVTYDGTRISPWVFVASHNARFVLEKQIASIQRYSDGTVKVHFNPNTPKKSFLIIAGKIGIFITFFISILPITLYYFQYYM